jgi:carboxyl-terminal processing protease
MRGHMLRLLIFAGALLLPSASLAQQALGVREVDAAFTAIERRCAADLQNTYAPTLARINELVVQHGAAAIEAEPTRTGVLSAYASALTAAPSLDEADLARAAVESMATAVDGPGDEYYLDFREFRNCDCRASVGVELRRGQPQHTVLRALDGAPAESVLTPGDRITAINGADVSNLPASRVVRMLRGATGSVVAVTVARGEGAAPVTHQITRAVVVVPSVVSRVADGVGYIAIRSFQEDAAHRVEQAIRDMRRQSVRGYIIDLRNNSGGLLDQAIETADLFLERGVVATVLSARQCPAEEPAVYHSRAGDDTRGAPLVVITDGQTASGAELLASALVDRQRAVTVGQRTFGLGEIQTVVPLSERAGIRLVTGELSSPTGGTFAGGRAPTYETPEATPGSDPALQRAREVLVTLPN